VDNDTLYIIAERYFAFGAHHLADRWGGYSEGARRGALNSATRQFSRALSKAVDLDQTKWQEAVCEQAIALLVYGRVARNAGEADAYSLQAQSESNTADTPDIPMMGGFSVEALRACGWTGNIAMRG
jgi:hypothetical protein